MPLPDDSKVVETAESLVQTLRGAFGTPEQHRPAHAKGRLVRGTFVPSADAASLSTAPHFNKASTPLLVRFSNSTGLPNIPDNNGNADPRGIGIRFVLSKDGHKHTDVIAHSTAFFPMKTGEGFLEMLGAIGSGKIGEFLAENPSAAAFVNNPKPAPLSFATEKYFGVNAFKFRAADGKETLIRYRIIPDEYAILSKEDLESKSESYLFDELSERLQKGPATLKLVAQLAGEGDRTDDATVHWPEERKVVELGVIKLEEVEGNAESMKEQKHIIFDPLPRVDGIEASDDPLLDMRAAVYLLSGRGRRAAPEG